MTPVSAREWNTTRATAILGTAIPFSITALILGGHVSEANPVTGHLINTVGWTGTGLLALAFIALAFKLFEHVDQLGHHHTARFGAYSLAGIGVLNTLNDVFVISSTGFSGWNTLSAHGPTLGLIFFASIISLSPLSFSHITAIMSGSRQRYTTVFFIFVLVLAPIVGVINLGPVSPVGRALGSTTTVDFEDQNNPFAPDGSVVAGGVAGSYIWENIDSNADPSMSISGTGAQFNDFYATGISQVGGGGFEVQGSGGEYVRIYSYQGSSSLPAIKYFDGSTSTDSANADLSTVQNEYIQWTLIGNSTGFYAIYEDWDSSWSETVELTSVSGSSNSITAFGVYTGASGSDVRLDEFSVSTYSETLSQPVSGTVTDSDGNPIDGATVSASQSGSEVANTTTAADGTYSFDLADGTYDIVASQSGYLDASTTVTVSGSPVPNTNLTLGTRGVSGRVVACPATNQLCQNPQGVPDGTIVEAYGVRETNINLGDAATLSERAEEIRDEISTFNAEQIGWEPDLQLTGDGGEFANANSNYVAVHRRAEWGLEPWGSPDLTNPKLTVPAGEPIILSVWDPDSGVLVQDGTDKDLPGTTTSGKIEITQLDYSGGTLNTQTVDTDQVRESAWFSGASDHSYAEVNLAPGFYRVRAEGSAFSYVITVGSPQEQLEVVTDNLETEAGALSARAQEIRDYVETDKVVKITTTTYSENGTRGHFSLSQVPEDVNIVAVQAYSPSAEQYRIDDPANASIQDLREIASLQDYNESFYVTPLVADHQIPSEGVTIRAVEIGAAPFLDPTLYQNQTQWLKDLFENDTYADAVAEYLDINTEDTEEIKNQLIDLRDQNADLQDRYDELREQYEDGTELTDDEEIRLLRQAIRDLQGQLQSGEVETPDWSDENLISTTIPWNADLDAGAYSVVAHYPNSGTSVPVPDEYVSVNKRTGRSDELVITDFPVPEGTNFVTFGVTVSGEDGEAIGNTKVPVRNPAFDGRVLDLDSISVSTLRPGPSESVTLELHPGDESARIADLNATVDSPNGEISVTKTGTESIEFATNGAGNHYVTLEITDTKGNTWTEAVTLKAFDENVNQPPGVRVTDGFTGTYVLVGDGLESGSVSTESGTLKMTAVAASENVPSSVHFYTSSVSSNYAKNDVRIMKSSDGGEPESVRKHVKVFVHTAEVTENAVVYRNDDEPLGLSGEETRYGSVVCGDSDEVTEGCTLRSFTDGNGHATFTINNHPNVVDRIVYYVRTKLPAEVPFLSLANSNVFTLLAWDADTPALDSLAASFGGVF